MKKFELQQFFMSRNCLVWLPLLCVSFSSFAFFSGLHRDWNGEARDRDEVEDLKDQGLRAVCVQMSNSSMEGLLTKGLHI